MIGNDVIVSVPRPWWYLILMSFGDHGSPTLRFTTAGIEGLWTFGTWFTPKRGTPGAFSWDEIRTCSWSNGFPKTLNIWTTDQKLFTRIIPRRFRADVEEAIRTRGKWRE